MGLLSGAMSGFGGAVADIAGGHIKNEINLDYQSQLMAMQEQRDARADERRQRIKRDDDQHAFDKRVERNQQEIEMEVSKKRATGDVENEQMRTREGNRRVDDLGFKVENLGYMTKVEREMTKARDLDKDAPGRELRNQLTQEQINDRQEVRKEREERIKVLESYGSAVDGLESAKAANDKAKIESARSALDAAERKVRAHDRRFGRQDSVKEWRTINTPDGVIRENQRTGEVEQVDVRGLPRHTPGGGGKSADPLGIRVK